MKVNKYIIGMFVATATFFVSCNTDNEGDINNGGDIRHRHTIGFLSFHRI